MIDPVLYTPEGKRAADIALRLAAARPRRAFRAALYPTEDQALELACKLLDAGADVEDEQDVIRAVALLKSKLPLRELAAATQHTSDPRRTA